MNVVKNKQVDWERIVINIRNIKTLQIWLGKFVFKLKDDKAVSVKSNLLLISNKRNRIDFVAFKIRFGIPALTLILKKIASGFRNKCWTIFNV